MPFVEFAMAGLATSETLIRIKPTHGYNEVIQTLKNTIRSQGAQLNTYKMRGGQYRISLPVTNVSSSNASQINSWWMVQEKLYFSELNGAFPGTIIARLNNQQEPFPIHVRGNFERLDGVLQIISIVNY